MNEKQLTKAVIQLLLACGWYVIQTHRPGLIAIHKGITDLIAISPRGEVVFIELKGPRGKLHLEQKRFIDEMVARGLTAFFADNIEYIVKKLGLQVLV